MSPLILLVVFYAQDILGCMQTVPGGDGLKSACQSCPPLYDETMCQGIAGCRAVPEADSVVYSYGVCTTATLRYTPDSQLVIKGYEPFTKMISAQAAAVARLQCTSDSKWVGDFAIGSIDVEGILFYTTDCIECAMATVQTSIGDITDAELCTSAVTCFAGTTYTLEPSTSYCSLVNFQCPPEADVIVAVIDGVSTPISLSDITPGTAQFTCKTGQMATVTNQLIAQGEVTKASCAKRNPCSGCEISDYLMPGCKTLVGISEAKDSSGCITYKIDPATNDKVVLQYTIEGSAPVSVSGQEAIADIAALTGTCINNEIHLTIPGKLNNAKLAMNSLSPCYLP